MAIFISDEFNLGNKLEKLGVFDSLMDEDSNFFINIIRLRDTKILEFSESYDNINKYFKEMSILLKASKSSEDKLYKSAVKSFKFSEVKGINLGFSKGTHGAGFGPILSNQIVKDASEIIKSGSEQPEIFHLTSLFEENVGPDRLSDMIATLIYDDIVRYTKRIYKEIGINKTNFPKYSFDSGLLKNPYKDCELLLLPIDILHELPIANSWEDIDRVVKENRTIREEFSKIIGAQWKKLATSQKKRYIKDLIFMNPKTLSKVISDYKSITINVYNVYQNFDYLIIKQVTSITKSANELDLSRRNSYEASLEIIEEYKDWVENKKGFIVLNNANSKDEEKIVQRTIHGVASYYCKVNNLDISPESNSGRGPVDFKISRGKDKTVIEIKLTSNPKCIHGFDVQIEEYAKSEGTDNKIFILIDNGLYSKRVTQVKENYEKRLNSCTKPATIIVIDAKSKNSASIYNPKNDFRV